MPDAPSTDEPLVIAFVCTERCHILCLAFFVLHCVEALAEIHHRHVCRSRNWHALSVTAEAHDGPRQFVQDFVTRGEVNVYIFWDRVQASAIYERSPAAS